MLDGPNYDFVLISQFYSLRCIFNVKESSNWRPLVASSSSGGGLKVERENIGGREDATGTVNISSFIPSVSVSVGK